MFGTRFEAIRPFLEAQPYIKSCEWTWGCKITHDFSGFRSNYQLHGNLAVQQANHIGVTIEPGCPWLSVPSPNRVAAAVIARSSRYHNPLFPWRKILSSYPDKVFVGTLAEHKEFAASYGEIAYYETKDLLELARVIAGAEQVIVNQTCAWWLSAGLGVPTIQETMQRDQNSIIERQGLRYTRDIGEVNTLLNSLSASRPSSSCAIQSVAPS